MTYPAPFVAQTDRERRVIAQAESTALVAAEHAARHDRDGTFPIEGLAELAHSGYLALAIPHALGGETAPQMLARRAGKL